MTHSADNDAGQVITVTAFGLDADALDALFDRVADAAHALDEEVTCSGVTRVIPPGQGKTRIVAKDPETVEPTEHTAEFDAGCGARMVAMGDPGHTHVCTGPHDADDHNCTACGRYFWHAMEALGERVIPPGEGRSE